MEALAYLKSSASNLESYSPFFDSTDIKPNDLNVSFITTAASPARDKHFIQRDFEAFRRIGFGSVEEYDIARKTPLDLTEELGSYDMFFLSGGSTFYLMRQIRNSGFDQVLPEFLKSGKILMSSSAGTIAAGLTTEPANWKNQNKRPITKAKYLEGLGIVPFAIVPHIDEENESRLVQLAESVHYPLVALSDEQAILLQEGSTEIVGNGERLTFNMTL